MTLWQDTCFWSVSVTCLFTPVSYLISPKHSRVSLHRYLLWGVWKKTGKSKCENLWVLLLRLSYVAFHANEFVNKYCIQAWIHTEKVGSIWRCSFFIKKNRQTTSVCQTSIPNQIWHMLLYKCNYLTQRLGLRVISWLCILEGALFLTDYSECNVRFNQEYL